MDDRSTDVAVREAAEDGEDQGSPREGLASEPTSNRDRRLTPGLIVALLALIGGLGAVGWFIGSGRLASDTEAAELLPDLVDTFDGIAGPIEDGEGTLPWNGLGPSFVADAGRAVVAAADADESETSMALLDPGWTDMTASIDVGEAAPGAGLVFRFEDLFNHWSLVAAPDFGTWNLVLTVDGDVQETQAIGLASTSAGTRITVVADGARIQVLVDGIPAFTLADPTFERATTMGLIATTGSSASFDRFAAHPRLPTDAER